MEEKESARAQKKRRRSEREALLEEFYVRLAPAWKSKRPLTRSYLGMQANQFKLTLEDLYYIRSVCADEERRGGSYSLSFWGGFKPRKSNPQVPVPYANG